MNDMTFKIITACESRNIFRKSNIWVLAYVTLNIVFIWATLSGFSWNPKVLFHSIIFYAFSLLIALSPIGEWMLRLQTGCKKIKRKDQLEIIEPIFKEAYAAAQTASPGIPKNIKLYINASNTPNAFATGRKTICVTRGLLKMPKEQIKAILGHEFGHIAHRDTYLLQAVIIGNFLVTGIIIAVKAIVWIGTTIAQINALSGSPYSIIGNSMQFVVAGITKLLALIGISVFSWIWTKLGILMVRKSSRENEFEADRFAASCGYADDLIAALDYLADTQDDGEDAKGLFNQLSKTHPDLDTRIARLQEIVNAAGQSPAAENEATL